jgi:DNA invertase Pin-like site-specific DNA recombinase
MTFRFEQATEVMCSTASFHRDHAGWKLGYIVDERLTPHRPANDDGSGSVDTDYTAGVLTQINTKDNNRHLPTPSRIYEDMASGRHDARPSLTACLKALQPGNTLVIWKLGRLGRDLRHLVTTAEDLRSRGIGLKVLAGAGAQIDTTSANGRLAFGIFAAFAEFERELIAERTHAGLAAARARGRMGGRPRKMNRATLTMAMAAMSDRCAVAADVAKRLGITTTTLYVYVNGEGSPKAAGQALLDAGPARQPQSQAA